jgi:thiol-disulfide isomerase/thioredoxin
MDATVAESIQWTLEATRNLRAISRLLLSIAVCGFFSFATLGHTAAAPGTKSNADARSAAVAAATKSAAAAAAPGPPESNDLPLVDLASYKQVLAKYRGKPVMVTFWATWCDPCRAEYPMIVNLAKQYAPKGLVVFGVDLDADSDLKLVHQFIAEHHPGFPNYRQDQKINADEFYRGVNPDWSGSMPHTVFYGRDGHIVRYFVGERPADAFEHAIQSILVAPTATSRKVSIQSHVGH